MGYRVFGKYRVSVLRVLGIRVRVDIVVVGCVVRWLSDGIVVVVGG